MYMCGNCRKFENTNFRVVYSHAASCTDYYFDRPDYNSDTDSNQAD